MGISIETLAGRMTDLDSHEMIPPKFWGECFGPTGALLAPVIEPMFAKQGSNSILNSTEDVAEITPDNVWAMKGCGAPSAIDLNRRMDVLDTMGVHRQILYPSYAAAVLVLALLDAEMAMDMFGFDTSGIDTDAITGAAIREYNDWVVRRVEFEKDRVRPAAIIHGKTIVDVMAEAERMIDSGVRVLWIPTSAPLAGVSPADAALDPFWGLCQDSNVAVTSHIASEFALLRSTVWGKVPQLAPEVDWESVEAPPFDPYHMTTLSFGPANFIAVMVLGGVLERFPSLRVGVIESFADWVGPLAETMDLWVEKLNWTNRGLSMRPSAYLARNVRVTPHYHEPVDLWLERYPHLADVYCFSTDYPHIEGGKYSLQRFYDRIAPLGDEIIEKFFVTNGEWLLPA